MRNCHSLLTAFAACSLLAAQACAQPVAAQPATPAHRAAAPLATTASAGLNPQTALRGAATRVASTTTVTAAGSVLVLADGIVADARMAPLPPPAPGFQYER